MPPPPLQQLSNPEIPPTSLPPDPSSPQSQPSPEASSEAEKQATSAFTASLHSLGNNYTTSLVDRAQNLHSNSVALKSQEERLRKTTEELGRQNKEWEGVAEEARVGLKEIGDVQNWAEIIERELLVVESVVDSLEGEAGKDGNSERRSEEGVVNWNRGANGVGKVDEEEGDVKGKGKAKGKGSEKKGWFAWW
ncbi:hypothetical protein BDV12DRAFT_195672 [Aspergillus spectabilis]